MTSVVDLLGARAARRLSAPRQSIAISVDGGAALSGASRRELSRKSRQGPDAFCALLRAQMSGVA